MNSEISLCTRIEEIFYASGVSYPFYGSFKQNLGLDFQLTTSSD